MEHQTITKLEERVMRRVYGVWLFRRIRYSSFTKLCLIGVLALLMHEKVSFRHVFQNSLLSFTSVTNLAHYFWYASLNTVLAVKLGLFAGAAVGVLLFYDITRSVAKTFFDSRRGNFSDSRNLS